MAEDGENKGSGPSETSVERRAYKRRFPKRNASATVTVDKNTFECLIYDLSQGGVQMFIEKALATGETATVNLNTPDGQIGIEGKVIWSRQAPLSGRVIKEKLDLTGQVGINFFPLTPEQKAVVDKILGDEKI